MNKLFILLLTTTLFAGCAGTGGGGNGSSGGQGNGSGNASLETVVPACGFVIDKPGVFVLDKDLGTIGENCVLIRVNSTQAAWLDCKGHKITGHLKAGIGVSVASSSNVVVQNCEVSNFNTGIGLDYSSNSVVYANKLSGNTVGLSLYYS